MKEPSDDQVHCYVQRLLQERRERTREIADLKRTIATQKAIIDDLNAIHERERAREQNKASEALTRMMREVLS